MSTAFTAALEKMMRAHSAVLEDPTEEKLRAFTDASAHVKELHLAVELASFERLRLALKKGAKP